MLLKQKKGAASSTTSAKWILIVMAIALGFATLVFLFAAPGGAVLPLTFGAALLLSDVAPAVTCEEPTD